ncbi:MAG: ABC transporter substrate-binding protein [Lachnospiraceae bacterium]|nr:ABC transporter substrate-binding protein [Lachnospiraceae bacterium]
MKKLLAMLLTLVLLLPATVVYAEQATEGDASAETVTIRLGGLKGPTSMGMVKLLQDAQDGVSLGSYEFTMAGSADELTPLFLKGDLDILAVPANLGAVLYSKSEGAAQMLAINTLGVIYICENGGETVNSLADLKGKTVYATGKGSTPEYVLAYLLSENGLEMGTDVTVEWKSEPTEVVAQMKAEESSGESTVAMLPQPFVTVAGTQLEAFRVAVDLTQEWKNLDNGSQLVTAGLIIRKAFAEEHPDEVAQFLEEYSASTQYVNENVEDAAALIEAFDIVKAPIAQKAIPFCNIVCITGTEMKQMLEGYFQVLFDREPSAVGGSMPGEDFYYISE